MPDLTPAEELRTAAASLKARAAAARRGTPTPWTPGDLADPELYWIALMDPDMGQLLADWLEWMVRAEHGASIAIPTEALAVARKINAKTKEQP